jgi:glycosyltransferase involved in cell wall biosynthesis
VKVLHLYSGNLFGGVETLLVTLAKQRSVCPQMQPHFALCFEGRLATELRAAGVDVHILGKVRSSRPWTVWLARRQLDRLLIQERFDAAICHACWPQAIFGSVVRTHRLPLVFWCHDTPKGDHWIERWAKQTPPDVAIANSRYTQAAVPNLYPTSRNECLYYPVPDPNISNRAELRRSIRAELNAPDDAVVIVQSSRLERWKGQTLLLSALGQLRDVPNWVCWIAGGAQRPHEAEYLQELQAQAGELGVGDRVQFLGQRADVPRLLVAADIHCQPNTGPEPFGIAFVEALYAGLPVVTTAMGGGMEIVDASCGQQVAPNDAKALSEVLRSLVTNPDQRATLAAGGRLRACALCDPAQQMTKLHDLLYQLVQQEAVA